MFSYENDYLGAYPIVGACLGGYCNLIQILYPQMFEIFSFEWFPLRGETYTTYYILYVKAAALNGYSVEQCMIQYKYYESHTV